MLLLLLDFVFVSGQNRLLFTKLFLEIKRQIDSRHSLLLAYDVLLSLTAKDLQFLWTHYLTLKLNKLELKVF